MPIMAAPSANTYYGAKKSIAAVKFDANGAFLNSYGGWDVGGGLSAIMVSELKNTGAFRVVNRSDRLNPSASEVEQFKQPWVLH